MRNCNNVYIRSDEIISSSEISRNFSKYRNEIKENKKSKLVIFKNNKPDLVLFSYEQYEYLIEMLNRLEDELIYQKLESKSFNQDDKTYSLDDVKNKIQEIKNSRK